MFMYLISLYPGKVVLLPAVFPSPEMPRIYLLVIKILLILQSPIASIILSP